MAQKRKHKNNAAKQRAYRAHRANVTRYGSGAPKQPVGDSSAVNANAHGRVAPGAPARFLQNPETHDDVRFVQSFAMADDEIRLKGLQRLHKAARALLPLQRKAHPDECQDRLWERALERAFVIIHGVKPPDDDSKASLRV